MKEEEERERDELMSRKFTPNDQDTSIQIDAALTHHSRLHDSHREIDNIIDAGSNVFDNLRQQRMTLKGAHKKILDLANTLGLSNTVMRLIEKRNYQDKYILFGGMVVTCVIMFLIWRYFTWYDLFIGVALLGNGAVVHFVYVYCMKMAVYICYTCMYERMLNWKNLKFHSVFMYLYEWWMVHCSYIYYYVHLVF